LDFESIFKFGLDRISNIDVAASDEIYDISNHNHIIILRLIKEDKLVCPNCGLYEHHCIRGSVTQDIKHSSAIEDNLIIKLKRRVYKCECGSTFKESNPFTESKHKLTIEKEYRILEALTDINKSYRDIAREFNISPTTVTKVFDSHISLNREPFGEILCVDEVYSKHCGYHKYCFITYNPINDHILDILPSRHKEDLCAYFGNIPKKERNNVKFFSMDLYKVYREVAQLCFPNALICADPFHVIKNLSKNFNDARIKIMKAYEHLKKDNDNYYWLYKKYWRKLLKAPEKLGYKKFQVSRSGQYMNDREIVEYMLSLDPKLRQAYELLNEYRVFNSCATIDNASEWLDELIAKFHSCGLPSFYKSYKLLINWRQEIINSFHIVNGRKISNGGMERANRDVKTIIRHAYGFTNFNRFRNRVMLIKNKVVIIR